MRIFSYNVYKSINYKEYRFNLAYLKQSFYIMYVFSLSVYNVSYVSFYGKNLYLMFNFNLIFTMVYFSQ